MLLILNMPLTRVGHNHARRQYKSKISLVRLWLPTSQSFPWVSITRSLYKFSLLVAIEMKLSSRRHQIRCAWYLPVIHQVAWGGPHHTVDHFLASPALLGQCRCGSKTRCVLADNMNDWGRCQKNSFNILAMSLLIGILWKKYPVFVFFLFDDINDYFYLIEYLYKNY